MTSQVKENPALTLQLPGTFVCTNPKKRKEFRSYHGNSGDSAEEIRRVLIFLGINSREARGIILRQGRVRLAQTSKNLAVPSEKPLVIQP